LRFAFNEITGILSESANNFLDLTSDNWFALVFGTRFVPRFLQFTSDSTGAIVSALVSDFEPQSPPLFNKVKVV